MTMMSSPVPSAPPAPPMPPSPPAPPAHPPSPAPIELLIADVVSWFWLFVLLAMIVISAALRAGGLRPLRKALSAKPGAGGLRAALCRYAQQCMSSLPRSRSSAAEPLRAAGVGLLRSVAVLFLVSAALVFYGEARCYAMTSAPSPYPYPYPYHYH